MNLSTRRRLATAAVPLILLMAACGGGDDGSDDRATTVTAPTTEPADTGEEKNEGSDGPLTQAQLEAALLTVQELPTGYKQGTVTPDDDSPTQSDNPECAERFKKIDEEPSQQVAKAEAAFEGSGLGTILEQTLASFEDEDFVSDRLAEFTTLFSDCPSFSITDEAGETSTVTISALSFPKLGDETVAFAAGIETADFNLTLNVAAIRVGSSLQTISQGGLSASAADLEQAARTGTEKLQAAG